MKTVVSSSVRSHIRSNVVGYVALFMAMGGISYAAGLTPDSVKSKHIKNEQVKAVDIDPTQVQARVGANGSAGQAIRAVGEDGSVQCETDDVGGGGTVTQVNTGTGVSGGPITSTGTIDLADAYRLPQSCADGEVAKSNGSGTWSCAADTDTDNTFGRTWLLPPTSPGNYVEFGFPDGSVLSATCGGSQPNDHASHNFSATRPRLH